MDPVDGSRVSSSMGPFKIFFFYGEYNPSGFRVGQVVADTRRPTHNGDPGFFFANLSEVLCQITFDN